MFHKLHKFISKCVDFLSAHLHIDRKFIKFLFVGAINTVFGYLMYSIFISTPLHRSTALLCAYIAGVMWNFKTTGVLVFKNGDNSLIFRFIGSYVITYFINLFFLNIFAGYGVNKYIAQLIMVLPIAVLSFVFFKKFVFVVKK